MDHDFGTVSASKVAFIPHDSIRQLIRSYPRIGDAFWRDTLVDASMFREWMVGLGRREAVVRARHLICELIVRMRVNGVISGESRNSRSHRPLSRMRSGCRRCMPTGVSRN